MLNSNKFEIKNKTILLICKERTFFQMYALGKELEKNNNVHYYFMHYSDVFKKNSFNQGTFFFIKSKINSKYIHDVKDVYMEFFNNRKNIKINFERVKEIEKKYTFFSGLNKQILSSQLTSTPYHDRFYFSPTNYEENLYWLILNYDKAESILEKIKPDFIYDTESGEIQRTIINEIANYKKLPYINMEHSRYKDYFLPCFSLGIQLDEYFSNAFFKNKKDLDISYLKKVEKFRNQEKIMPEIYIGQSASSYNFNFWQAIKFILFKTYKFIRYLPNSIKQNHKNILFNSPLYTNPIKKILWNYFFAFRKFYLYSKFNKYFEKPKDEKYVYFPLHKIPESSTFTKSPIYTNEINLIEAISKSIPISWKLYIKEHQSMIGERSLDFYKRVKKLHNVKIIKSNFYNDPKPWIENSLCVVTITGTSGFEAAMLNKPAIVFGNVFYNVVSGIKFANSFNELENLFKQIKNNNWEKDNTIDCAAYLKTVEEVGTAMSITDLKDLSRKKINSEELSKKEEDKLVETVKQLKTFYEKAISIYFNLK